MLSIRQSGAEAGPEVPCSGESALFLDWLSSELNKQDHKIAVTESRRNGPWPSTQITDRPFVLFLVFAKISTTTGCLYGKAPPTRDGKPLVKGISAELLQAMMTNLRTIPGVKWQYLGNKEGVMFNYPSDNPCDQAAYDPRLRFVDHRII